MKNIRTGYILFFLLSGLLLFANNVRAAQVTLDAEHSVVCVGGTAWATAYISSGYWNETYRTGIDFDTTSIPDAATITKVELKLYIDDEETPLNNDVGNMTKKAYTYHVTDDDKSGFDSDVDGNQYLSNSGGYAGKNSYHTVELLAAARTDLKNQLSANWFSVGFTGTTEADNKYRDGHTYAEANPPQLIVTYTVPTTIGDGTNPGNSTIAPGAAITDLDAFTFVTVEGTDSVTSLTVTLAAGTSAGLSEVRITSDNGSTTYFSAVSNPASDTVNFSGGTAIPVTTTSTQFKVRITPKSHANMPVPAGSEYAVTGTVTSFTSTKAQAGTDTASATITIDNLSPGNVTGASATPGDTQVTVSWTNPGDSDFSNLVVLRNTATITDDPDEGTSPNINDTIPPGNSVVRYIASGTSFLDTGLTNGQIYYYRIFAKDSNGNYSATGVEVSASPRDADGNLTSAASVTEPVAISSIADTEVERVAVFDFTITDGGTSDGLALGVSQIVLNTSGTGTFSDLTWQLDGPDVSYVTGSVAAGTITFGSLSISVADNTSDVYTVYAYFSASPPTSTDNQTFILSVDGDTDLTIVPGGTQMSSTTAEDNGTGSTMNVVHSQLTFTTQPPSSATINVDFAGTIAVSGTDVNGNVDEDLNENITISAVKDSDKNPGSGMLSSADLPGGLTKTPSSGVATWTDTKYDTVEVIDIKAVSATYGAGLYSDAVSVDGDQDGNLTSAAGVTEPVAISSIADTEVERVAVFDFTITDGGTSDKVALGVSQIVLNTSGTGTFSDLTWQLDGPDASYVTGSVAAGTITFGSLSISVADNTSDVYTVYAYFSASPPTSTDNQTFILSVDGDTDLTIVPGGTQMGSTTAEDNGTGSTMNVVGTQLTFTTQPPSSATVDVDFAGTIGVSGTDINGNVDVDFNEDITISAVKDSDKSPSVGILSSGDAGGLTQTPSSGTATWTDTEHDTVELIDVNAVSTTYDAGTYSTAVTVGALPGSPTLYSVGGAAQLSFNNAKQNTTTPRFRASATCSSDFDAFFMELNTQADFGGTAYTQTFSGTYVSDTQYNLLCDSLSSSLPTTDGVTYYVRSKASSNAGTTWGGWSSGTWSFTYSSTSGDLAWHQTTDEQFDTGTLSLTDTDAPNDRVKISGWLSGGWDQRIKMTIDSAGSKVDSDLTDFPILVYLSTSSGIGSDDVSAVFDELTADANRKKIAVTKSDGTTELYVEIEKWDDASETAWLWVKVAGSNSISSSADTDLYLYYDVDHADNTTYVGDPDSTAAENVWDPNHAGVWHLRETDIDGGAGDIKDSTDNDNDGTTIGMTGADQVGGQIDGSFDFDGSDEVNLGTPSSLKPTDAITVSAWVETTGAVNQYDAIFGIASDSNWDDGYGLWWNSSSDVRFHINVYNNNFAASSITSSGRNHVVGTYDSNAGGTDEIKIYVNGVLGGTVDDYSTSITYPGGNVEIAEIGGWGDRHLGLIDEVRVSNIARSAAWIEASFYSGDDNLVTFGSEETSSFTITSPGIDYDSFVGATDWDWVKIKQDETNGDIKYTVQYLSGTWQDTSIVDVDGDVNGVYNYIDISSLTPATHNEIRIVATFTDSGGTPYLEDWTVMAAGVGPTIVDLTSFEAIGHFGKVSVEWETDSEINNAGFNVFRSEHPHYGFNKLNSALIAGLGSSAIGKEYRFWDDNVTDGITYYYILEDVEFDGKSTMHGPIQAHPGLDSDGDGMTNDWENYYSLKPYDASDALVDPDGDGLANLDEFIQGKHPIISDISQPPSEPAPKEADISTSLLEDGVKIRSDDYGIILELITPSFETETKVIEDEAYQVIKLPFPHGQTTEAGKPQIPVKGVLLGIPFDSTITFNLVSYEKEILSGYNLYPVPRIQRERNFSNKRRFKEGKMPGELTYKFFKDTNTYSRNGFYPDCLAEIAPVGSLRGQSAAKVNIYPIQFNPVTGELEFYKRIELEVDFGKKAEIDQENIHKPSTPFDKLHKRLFYNYGDVKSWKHRSRRYTRPDKFAPRSACKISVNEEGIYRLTWQDLLYGAGLNPYWLDPRKIKIYHRGDQIPIYVAGQRDGWFDCDDYIEFYAEALNTRFTSTNIYWLMTDGSRGQRMRAKRSFGRSRREQTPTSFLSDIHHEEDRIYWMEIPDKGYVDDHWFFSDSLWAPGSVDLVDFVIPLSDVADVKDEAMIKIALQGISHGFSGPDHHTYIYLNGHLLDDATWDGDTEYIRQLNVPQSYFVEGDNIITVELPGDTGAEIDEVLANWFEVSYWRQFKAKGNALKFNNQGRGRYSYQISNFTENDIEIFDITNPKKVERIVRSVIKQDGASYTVGFKDILLREKNKDYLVLSSSGMKSPVSIVKDEPSNLRFRGNQADYIISNRSRFLTY